MPDSKGWKRGTVRINVNPNAITPDPNPVKESWNKGYMAVHDCKITHIPTGLGMGLRFRNTLSAKIAADRIIERFPELATATFDVSKDWPFEKQNEAGRFFKALEKELR